MPLLQYCQDVRPPISRTTLELCLLHARNSLEDFGNEVLQGVVGMRVVNVFSNLGEQGPDLPREVLKVLLRGRALARLAGL